MKVILFYVKNCQYQVLYLDYVLISLLSDFILSMCTQFHITCHLCIRTATVWIPLLLYKCEIFYFKMAASNEKEGYLTNKQIVRLAAAISADNMAAIVEGYMDISDETIKNKKYENKDSAEAFNREILKYWINKNSGPNQITVWKLINILLQTKLFLRTVVPFQEILSIRIKMTQTPSTERS